MQLQNLKPLWYFALCPGSLLPGTHASQVADAPSKSKAAKNRSIDPRGLKGIVLDDTQGERKGPWVEVSATDVRHLGSGFLQDNNTNKGAVSIVYTPEILEGGDYKIILISPPHENRAEVFRSQSR